MAEPYTDNPQLAAQIRQLLAERENADAYGQETRLEAIDKQLKELGFKSDKQAAKAVDDDGPKGRSGKGKQQTTEGKQQTTEG